MSWLLRCCGSSSSSAPNHDEASQGERQPLLINVAPSAHGPPGITTTVTAARIEQEPITTDEALVVVLLDGDADFFKSEYLTNGFHGGRRASIALHERVRAFLHQRKGPARPRIVVMSFCNLFGVSSHIAKKPLQAFVQGFCSSPFASTMVDTGPASQSADNALRNHLEALIASCHLMIVGGNHDGGLAVVLHRLESHLLKRVVLLRTTPFVATPLKDMKLDQVVFEDLFDGRDPRPEGQRGATKAISAGVNATAQQHHATPKKVATATPAKDENVGPTPALTASTMKASKSQETSRPAQAQAPTAAKTPLQPTSAHGNLKEVPKEHKAVDAQASQKTVKERKSYSDLKESGEAEKQVEKLVAALIALRDAGNKRPTLPVIRSSFDCAPWPVVDVVRAAEESGRVKVRYEEGSEGHWIELVGPKSTLSGASAPAMTSTSSSDGTSTPASLKKIPGRFRELIDVMLMLREKGEKDPLRSKIGTLVTTNRNTTFKELCTDAQAFGLVKLGKGKTSGSETVSLTEAALKMTSGVATGANGTGKPATAQKDQAAPKKVDGKVTPAVILEKSADAKKLVAVLVKLKEEGQETPLRSTVGAMLAGKLKETTFKALTTACHEAGVVELGCWTGGSGHEWIRLSTTVEAQ